MATITMKNHPRPPLDALRGRRFIGTAAIFLLPLFSACQTTMSIEEARKVTASFAGRPFVPPPRTIEDITAVLDQSKPPVAAPADLTLVGQSAPRTADSRILADFHFRRGLAARRVGRAAQEIEDLSTAVLHAEKAGAANEGLILINAYLAEIRGGSFSRALDFLRRSIEKTPADWGGTLMDRYAKLTTLYAAIGNLRAAEEAQQQTLALFERSGSWRVTRADWLAWYESNAAWTIGAVEHAKGRFAEAERALRRSIAALAGRPEFKADDRLDRLFEHRGWLAQTLARQGRLVEAEVEARLAVRGVIEMRGRYSTTTANVLRSFIIVLFEQARYRDAEQLARAALDIYKQTGARADSFLAAAARLELGAALGAQGKWREAAAVYEDLSGALAADPSTWERLVKGSVNIAVALVHVGRVDEAIEVLNEALRREASLVGGRGFALPEVRGLMAVARAAKGDRGMALKEFAATVDHLLDPKDLGDEEPTHGAAREERVGLILRTYIALLVDFADTDPAGAMAIEARREAFRLAEVLRGRSVQRALNASATRAAVRTQVLGDLVRREQDSRKQITALFGALANLVGSPGGERDEAAIATLRAQIETLRRAHQALAQQIAREFGSYAKFMNPAPPTWEEARASLRSREALITTLVGTEQTLVWAVSQHGAEAFATVPLGANDIAAMVEKLRKALDPSVGVLSEIPGFDIATAHELYRALLEPVAEGWKDAESLMVVAHGPLAQLPLSLFVTRPTPLAQERGALFSRYRDVPWLGRRHAVTVLPSVGALVTLRRSPRADPSQRPFVGFGDPYFSPEQARQASVKREPAGGAQIAARGRIMLRNLRVEKANSTRLGMLPRLPDTADEVRSIAAVLQADLRRDVFLGAEANEQRVKTLDLAGYRVIAFATHGLVPGDLDGLTQPALALSAPEVARVDGDGLLTMEEILALRLNADWVVLSACNTASGQGAESEAISGLGRAFFYAGARALLVSNWPVETTSARALTTDLFRRQAADPSLPRAQALQQTMNALIDEGQFVDPTTNRVVFSYAHPIFWAPFTLVGDGG